MALNGITVISTVPLALAATAPPSPDTGYIIWAVALLGVAVLLFFVEVMVPSGGVIGFFSATSLIAGIVMLFKFNTQVGLIGAILSLMAVPFLFALALKLWPSTPIARMLLLKNPPRDDDVNQGDGPPVTLVGARGKAMTDLHPIGKCLIDGRHIECVAQTGLIRSGSGVHVVSHEGMTIKVAQDG
jgi:membrane-bound ClpP family serine protease